LAIAIAGVGDVGTHTMRCLQRRPWGDVQQATNSQERNSAPFSSKHSSHTYVFKITSAGILAPSKQSSTTFR
jgi:hypothetical protein